ncbi:MAG TPA: hypothetical protein VLV83_18240 [Acidobacteriota bacterium]|nr:hypothetical protein [Acidobacteriota bacterium]
MKLVKGWIVGIVLVGFCGWMAAQGMGQKVAMHFQVTPKAGMHMQFETALKAHLQWRKEQNDPWQWYIMEIINGTDYGDYIIRTDERPWAEMDNYELRFKGRDHFLSTVGPFIADMQSSLTSTNEALSNWPDDLRPRLILVEVFSLNPGKAEVFWQLVAKASKAFDGRMGHNSWDTVVVGEGAGGGTAILVLPRENWAGLAPRQQEMVGYMTEAYGEEEVGKMMQQFSDCLAGMNSMVVAVRPDLSLMGGN